jgi:hypothetical protein
MAGRGPAPKDYASRDRDQARRHASTPIVADGELRGFDLPPLDDAEWHPATVQWWATWRSSAQATTFTPTDWSFLLDTALLHDALWHGRPDAAGELRLRVAKFGATPEDRARLKMEVTTPPARGLASVSAISRDPRDRFDTPTDAPS